MDGNARLRGTRERTGPNGTPYKARLRVAHCEAIRTRAMEQDAREEDWLDALRAARESVSSRGQVILRQQASMQRHTILSTTVGRGCLNR